jgi:hypothetical protein
MHLNQASSKWSQKVSNPEQEPLFHCPKQNAHSNTVSTFVQYFPFLHMNLRYPPIAVSTFPADFACTTKRNLSDLKTLNVFSFSQIFFPPRTFPSHIPTQSVFFFTVSSHCFLSWNGSFQLHYTLPTSKPETVLCFQITMETSSSSDDSSILHK